MHQTVHPDDGPEPMDRPRQGDTLAGNMAGQIIGSVGTPLKDHEKTGKTQQQQYIRNREKGRPEEGVYTTQEEGRVHITQE